MSYSKLVRKIMLFIGHRYKLHWLNVMATALDFQI